MADGFVQGTGVIGYAESMKPLLRPRNSRRDNRVFVGTVVLPDGKHRSRAFVKLFPPGVRYQCVYNEVVARNLARQCDLPSPMTFACACPRRLLDGEMAAQSSNEPPSDFVLGVASISAQPRPVKQRLDDFSAAWEDLSCWPRITDLAVFDELIANDDRHLSNLLRLGSRNYVLIDNERILFGTQWFGTDLESLISRRLDANIIADSIAMGADEIMKRRMLTAAREYALKKVLRVPSWHRELEGITRAPGGATEDLIQMLNKRRQKLGGLLQWHLQKGDLFDAGAFR